MGAIQSIQSIAFELEVASPSLFAMEEGSASVKKANKKAAVKAGKILGLIVLEVLS